MEDATNWVTIAVDKAPDVMAIQFEGKFAGSIGYTRGIDINHRTAEIGYWLGKPFWNKGIMTDCLQTFTDYLFTETDLLRIYALPYSSNIASQHVLEKAGFKLEGILAKYVDKWGEILDARMYAKVK